MLEALQKNAIVLQGLTIRRPISQVLDTILHYPLEIAASSEDGTTKYDTAETESQFVFFCGMRLPCKHILKVLHNAEAYMFASNLVVPRWTQQYNYLISILSMRADIRATMGTLVRKKIVLTPNQKFREASMKLQMLPRLMSEREMPHCLE